MTKLSTVWKVSPSDAVALFTRMFTGPKLDSAKSNSAGITRSSPRSAEIAAARPPARRMRSRTSPASRRCASRFSVGKVLMRPQ
jgi:hypothetical protein